MLVAGIRQTSLTDGPGKRFVVVLPGCQHHCSGCSAAQGPDAGVALSSEELMDQISFAGPTDGLTLTGGDPFNQAAECALLCQSAREAGLNTLCQTPRTYETILSDGDEAQLSLLRQTDVLEETGLTRRRIRARESLAAGHLVPDEP